MSLAARAKADRATVVEAFRLQHGREPRPVEALLIQAVAELETNCGRGWREVQDYGGGRKRECPGASRSNNWGAIQARPGQPSFPCADTHQDGRIYAQAFRAYPSPVEGARDLVRHLGPSLRPDSWAAIQRGDLEGLSRAMYRERYYGSSCPKAIRQYGQIAAQDSSYGRRARKATAPQGEAGRACDEEAIGQHTARLRSRADAIADAIGEPRAPTGKAPGEGEGSGSSSSPPPVPPPCGA